MTTVTNCYDADLIEAMILEAKLPKFDDFSIRTWLDDPNNVTLINENGDCALFEYIPGTHGRYIGHYLFGSRGKEALKTANSFLFIMFAYYNAQCILGMVDKSKRNVSLFTRWLGFSWDGEVDTLGGTCDLFSLNRKDFK